jgi:hypothetical protein
MDYFQFTKRLLFNRGVGVDWKVGREEALWVDLKVEQAFEVDRKGGGGKLQETIGKCRVGEE